MIVSVVIVHHNTPDLLRQCLTSILGGPPDLHFEVIVVDNASSDPTVDGLQNEFSQVEFQFNVENVGFAQASNQGICLAQGKYVMLLNPDASIDGDGIVRMVEFMDAHPEAGVGAPRLVNEDGTLQLSCRRVPTMRAVLLRGLRLDGLFPAAVSRYLMKDWDHQVVREVDWVIGACMILKSAALEEMRSLDEGFFMYYEDVDLCHRMRQAGWKVYYEPSVAVRHAHQRGSASLLPNRLTYEHARSLFRLFRKHRFAWW